MQFLTIGYLSVRSSRKLKILRGAKKLCVIDLISLSQPSQEIRKKNSPGILTDIQ